MELTASVIYCSMTLKFSIPPMQNQPSPCSFSLAFCLNSRLQHLTSVFSASPAFLPPAKRGAFSLFSYGYELFCCFLHSPKTQLFSFHAIPHSFAKTPGVVLVFLTKSFSWILTSLESTFLERKGRVAISPIKNSNETPNC